MTLRVVNTGSKSGNSYILDNNTEALILDAGCRYKDILKALDWNTSKVCGVLLTHIHLDHSKAFKDFIRAGIPIYTNDETAEHFEIITGEKMFVRQERIAFMCGAFTITPFYVPHTTKDKETGEIIPCPNFGYMIRHEEMGTLLYMTDMEYCPYSFKNMRVQHLIIECNYIEELVDREQSNYAHRLQGHCSLETCKGIIRTNMTPALRTVTAVHLSESASDENQIFQEIKKIVGKRVIVNVAKSGLLVELSKYPF